MDGSRRWTLNSREAEEGCRNDDDNGNNGVATHGGLLRAWTLLDEGGGATCACVCVVVCDEGF